MNETLLCKHYHQAALGYSGNMWCSQLLVGTEAPASLCQGPNLLFLCVIQK